MSVVTSHSQMFSDKKTLEKAFKEVVSAYNLGEPIIEHSMKLVKFIEKDIEAKLVEMYNEAFTGDKNEHAIKCFNFVTGITIETEKEKNIVKGLFYIITK